METKQIVCIGCNETFDVSQYVITRKNGATICKFPPTKYCSTKCKSRTRYLRNIDYYRIANAKPKKIINKTCDVCDTSFVTNRNRTVTCSTKCSKRRWKILNAERNRINNLNSSRRCSKRDPERYRLYQKNRKHLMRVASRGISDKRFSSVFRLADWIQIKDRFNNLCAICGADDKLTIDHITPISKGGLHIKENIQPLCNSCNARKGNRL